MMKWEIRLRDSFQRNALWWAVAAAAALGVFIRWSGIPILVADTEFMNSSWYLAARESGVRGLLEVDCTYSPVFMYLFALLSPLLDMYPYDFCKLMAMVMEALMIPTVCALVHAAAPEGKKRPYTAVAFILLCFHPLLVLNASAWGQTDASYAALSMLALLMMLKGKAPWAMLFLGLALSFKLQAIFLLPAFLLLWLTGERRFSLFWFLLVPGVLVLSGLPMVLYGQSPLFAVECYLGQTGLYSKAVMNYPGLLATLGETIGFSRTSDGFLSRLALVFTAGALGGMAVALVVRKARFDARAILLLSAWCVLACAFLLPRMHERYGFVGEILLVCWALLLGKPRGYAYVLLGIAPVFSAYCEYMFQKPVFSLQLGGVMNFALLLALTWEVLHATGALPTPRAAREARA